MGSSMLNLGVVVDSFSHMGGGYQQQLAILEELRTLSNCKISVIVFSQEMAAKLAESGFEIVPVFENFLDKLIRSFLIYFPGKPAILSRLKTTFEKRLAKLNIDLVYFMQPTLRALELCDLNFIFTVWDLCHRDHPEFPEIRKNQDFETREFLYNSALKKATAILVDSDSGKANLMKRYSVDSERVFSVSFLPSLNIRKSRDVDIKSHYNIAGEYIFYPAQFWAHKNHTYILDALAILKKSGLKISAIFCGSDKGNLDYVLDYAHKKAVGELVKYIGYAPDEEIFSLYSQSLALVMPTYFGPTNMPPLEAFLAGTPVLYSDLDCFREQTADAALYFDLAKPESLAEILRMLIQSPAIRNDLLSKGNLRLHEIQKSSSIVAVLNEINKRFSLKLKCWKTDW